MSLRDAWERHAADWVRWARTPGHDDFFWRFNLPRLLALLPAPGLRTLDLGCGEGRLSRILADQGHRVVGIDGAPTLVSFAATHEQAQPVLVADAGRMCFRSGSFDLAVAMVSLQDVDDLEGAVREVARVLVSGGTFCFSIVHPINSGGRFADDGGFAIEESYFARRAMADVIERGGLRMVFESEHRPLDAYTRALESAGFVIEALREPVPEEEHAKEDTRVARWQRVPCFLQVRAAKR